MVVRMRRQVSAWLEKHIIVLGIDVVGLQVHQNVYRRDRRRKLSERIVDILRL